MAEQETVPSDGDYFVSPDGDDGNPGTYEEPFRTIEKARNTIRQDIENGQNRDIIVYIRGGKYYRNDTPLIFMPNHSGKDGFDIVYRNFPGETPEIIGGRVVSDWELHKAVGKEIEVTVNAVSSTDNNEETNQINAVEKRSLFQRILDFFKRLFALLKSIGAAKDALDEETSDNEASKETTIKVQPGIYKTYVGKGSEFYSLFENGRRAVLARTPNEGYAVTQDADVSGSTTKIMYFKEDLPNKFDYSNATVYIWGGSHGELKSNWVPDIDPIMNIDFDTRTMTLRDNLTYKAADGIRYFVQGSMEFLDNPGEFYLDKEEGMLYYQPYSYPIEDQEIIVPTTQRVLYLQGTPSKGVSNLRFEGLKITISDFGKDFSGSSRIDSEGMVYMENTSNITLKDCIISNAGYSAVSIMHYSSNNTIYGNLIENFGIYGVCLGADYWYDAGNIKNAEQGYKNKSNLISSNLIRNGGQSVGHGAGIRLAQSGDNEISHNLIYNMPRQGITMNGTSYPYMELQGSIYGTPITWENHFDCCYTRNNTIAYNHIYNVMNDASDGGAINCFGTGRGNIIENNYVHDVTSGPGGVTVGIYLDDASNYTIVRNNVLNRIGVLGSYMSYPFVLKGYDITLENNVVVNSKSSAMILLCESPVSMYAGHATAPKSEAPTKKVRILGNIFHETADESNKPRTYDLWYYSKDMIEKADYNTIYLKDVSPIIRGIAVDGTWNGWKDFNWSQWINLGGNTYDSNTIFEDPLFEDLKNDVFTVKEGSPALANGFVNIDLSKVGLKEDFLYD